MLLGILIIVLCCWPSDIAAQSRQYPIIGECSGAKFMARYKLSRGDFWIVGNKLVLKNGVKVSDNPPICEASDSPDTVKHNAAKRELNSQQLVYLRAIIAVMVDQLNAQRAPGTPPITMKQIHDAIEDKIDAGVGD